MEPPQLSTPVEVGHATGHHWFSSLHPVAGADILCEVVTTADEAQGKWPAALYLTRDAGCSWKKACEIDSYGPSSVALEPDRILLLPYELWPLSPGDGRNATADGTIVTCTDGTLTTESTPVRFLDFPHELDRYNDDELFLLTSGNVLSLRDGRLFTTLYGRFGMDTEPHQYECVAVASQDGGFTWNYLSSVVSWPNTVGAPEGPNESTVARLPDDRLMCICRVGSGRQHHYRLSYSHDEGASWTGPIRMESQWSVLPQLVCLEDGTLLLSGGRPGLMLWVCTDGEGGHWHATNLAAHHNAVFPDPGLHFAESCVEASGQELRHTTSYTGMVATGADEVLISYDRLGNGWEGAPGPWGSHDTVFTLQVRL